MHILPAGIIESRIRDADIECASVITGEAGQS